MLPAAKTLEITPHGTSVSSLQRGAVEMASRVVVPYSWLEKGNYTVVHAEMCTAHGARMTDFEGPIWVDGEAGDGAGERGA